MKRLLKAILPPFLVSIVRRLRSPTQRPEDLIPRPQFTNTWFADVRKNWDELLAQQRPARVLEIGSYEGASACYLIEKLGQPGPLEIHCIDSWEGGVEHKRGGSIETDMGAVERQFERNTRLAIEAAGGTVKLVTHKSLSDRALAALLADGKAGFFDLIYVDGSHQAPDVLFDAAVSFKLLRVGGILAFDDYLWREEVAGVADALRCPKPAIDAFANLYMRKLRVLNAPLGQLFIQKTSE